MSYGSGAFIFGLERRRVVGFEAPEVGGFSKGQELLASFLLSEHLLELVRKFGIRVETG
jgi:hypothetical protein